MSETGISKNQFPVQCPWSIEETISYVPPDIDC